MNKMPYSDFPDVLNAEQISALLGISRAGAYQLLGRADFPTLHIGKRKLVPKDKLLAWIDRQTEGGAFLNTSPNDTVKRTIWGGKYAIWSGTLDDK